MPPKKIRTLPLSARDAPLSTSTRSPPEIPRPPPVLSVVTSHPPWSVTQLPPRKIKHICIMCIVEQWATPDFPVYHRSQFPILPSGGADVVRTLIADRWHAMRLGPAASTCLLAAAQRVPEYSLTCRPAILTAAGTASHWGQCAA